jgi:hypothetical protein
MCVIGDCRATSVISFWLESHRVFSSITAADNISASTLTPHGERGVATGELERN